MFSVYILRLSNNKYYIGQTSDLDRRILLHRVGGSRYTKPYRPLKLIYLEQYKTRAEAMRREKYLKTIKNRSALNKIIELGGDLASSSNG